MKAEWVAIIISVIVALIAIVAAVIASSQARSARRQADAAHGEIDPTFHVQSHPSDGRPPFGFSLVVNNFNKRAIRLHTLRVSVPAGYFAYETDENSANSLRSIIRAVLKRTAQFTFALSDRPSTILPGVAPAGPPSTFDFDVEIGIRDGVTVAQVSIPIDVELGWAFASGDMTLRTEKMHVEVSTK